MLLDTTTKSLELKLGAAPSASQATYNVWVADHTTTTLTPSASDGATSGTTAVTAIPAPGANTQRQIKFLSVRNNDSADINVVVQLNNNSTIRTITSASISASNTLCYSDNAGFYVLDKNGNLLSTAAGGGAGDVSTDAIWDAAGDLIQGTGANTAARLAIGTANQILRVNSGATAVEWAGLGRMVFVSESTASDSASITFTDLSSTYRYYMLILRNIKPATNAVDLQLTMSTDNGSSFLAGTNYRWHLNVSNEGAATYSGQIGNANAFVRIANSVSNGASAAVSGWVNLLNMPSTTNTKHVTLFVVSNGSTGNVQTGLGAGHNTTTSAVDAVRLAFSSGNIASGTVALYGVL